MANCELITDCAFFNGRMATAMPAIVEQMKNQYCRGDNTDCARYMIVQALGKEYVGELAPDQIKLAKQLIECYTVQS